MLHSIEFTFVKYTSYYKKTRMKRVIQDIEYRAIAMISRMMQDVDKTAYPVVYDYLHTEYVLYGQAKYVLERFIEDDLESLVDVNFPPKNLASIIMFIQEGKDLLRTNITDKEMLARAYDEYGDAIQLLNQFYLG